MKRKEEKRITCNTNKIGWIKPDREAAERVWKRDRKAEMEYRSCHAKYKYRNENHSITKPYEAVSR